MSAVPIASRMNRFQSSPIQIAAARVRERTAAGGDIINLTIGEPGFLTPDSARDAAMRLICDRSVGYTPANGTLSMREAAQAKFRRDNQLEFRLSQITVGAGVKQILYNALMATMNTGDAAIIAAPYWTSYADLIRMTGGTPTIVDCRRDVGFKLQPEQLERAITPKTKWLLLNSPSNPTGATYSHSEYAALAEVLLAHPQVYILCDDIYEHLVFDGRRFVTIAQVEPRLSDRCVVCNGISKAYSMTGWRVGFAGGPESLIANMTKIQSQSTAGASAVSQAAAVAVLNGPLDYVIERTRNLQRRRDRLFDCLESIDTIACDRPEGALYAYCSCAAAIGKRTPDGRRIESDTDFMLYLLDSAGVAVVQGEAFGLSPYFRASFAIAEERLMEAAERIACACSALHG